MFHRPIADQDSWLSLSQVSVRPLEQLKRKPSARRKINYREYLQSEDWQEQRAAALKRAGYACQVCAGTEWLHVHHRTYVRLGREAKADLTVLCADCHALFHEHRRLAQGGRAL